VLLLLGLVASLGVGPYVAPRDCCCGTRALQTATVELPPCCAGRQAAATPATSCCQRPSSSEAACCGGGPGRCQCVGCPSEAPVEPLAPASVDTSAPTVVLATFCPTRVAPVAVRIDPPGRLAEWRTARAGAAEPSVSELFCVWVI
jgi:hypothetical protein